MTGVIEKLLENWLDNASERSYQAAFVQALTGLGYRVIHSTRHTALEFGKDVLAIAPDGIGCAYQLKGNPGGKLGLAQFRAEIQGQLVQLMSQPVVYPGFPAAPHRSFLVTNGYFEEEVHRAVDDMNRGPLPFKVSLISRGELLSWANTLGTSLWPSELIDARALLELVLHDPQEQLPAEKLCALLEGMFHLTENADRARLAEFERVTTSAALLIAIVTSNFVEEKNHYAVACAWGIFATSLIAACERHNWKLAGATLNTMSLAETAIFDALIDLWAEVRERKNLVEGLAMTDPEVYRWRYNIILGALSCLDVAHSTLNLLSEESAESLRSWLRRPDHKFGIWGEAAVAHLAPWLVVRRKHDPSFKADLTIGAIASAIISSNSRRQGGALVNFYYGFEEIARHGIGLPSRNANSQISRERFSGLAYTAECLMHLCVRANLKQTCKSMWPEFSRIGHRRFNFPERWQYCLYRVNQGLDETRQYPATYGWDVLKDEALDSRLPFIPEELALRPWLLCLWWLIAPHRFTADTCRYFANQVIPGWGT